MPLTDEQKCEVAEAFVLHDSDNDGTLTADEFKAACCACCDFCGYPTPSELEEYVAAGAVLSKDGFQKEMETRYLADLATKASAGGFFFATPANPFSVLGPANDGSGVTGKELKKVMKGLGEKYDPALLAKYLGDAGQGDPGDGAVDVNALFTAMQGILEEKCAIDVAGPPYPGGEFLDASDLSVPVGGGDGK